MTKFTMRSIVETDLAHVLEINQANVPDVGDLSLDRLRYLVDESSIALAVADAVDTIAGFCLILGPGSSYDSVNYTWFMEQYPDSLYLDRVAFDERFRGRGLGQALYAEVERLMRADHPTATSLTLEVNVDPPNEPSLRFHARQGFVEVGRQMSHGIEVSLMSKPL